VTLKHLLGFFDENLGFLRGIGPSRSLLFFGTQEERALWDKNTNDCSEEADACSSPEKYPPSVLGHQGQVDNGCNQVSNSIAFLQNPACNSTKFNG